jgi:dTMP kinase
VARPSAAETTVLPKVPDEAETTVLPPVPGPQAPEAVDETAVLPPVRERAPGDNPADRVPPGIFRDEPSNERTRELPQVAPDASSPRRRSDWAEETPLDDLPTLADELLGPRDDDEDDRRGRRR